MHEKRVHETIDETMRTWSTSCVSSAARRRIHAKAPIGLRAVLELQTELMALGDRLFSCAPLQFYDLLK